MKVGRTGLKMSSGEIRHFKSPGARARFEAFVQAHHLSKHKNKHHIAAMKRGS